MGTWGPGIYQNDTSADIKDFFIKYLKQGSSKEDVTKRIIEEFSCEMEEIIFFLNRLYIQCIVCCQVDLSKREKRT